MVLEPLPSDARLTDFPATRTEALSRLQAFAPKAGKDYARLRNYDLPQDDHPHVSRLSPYLRHRLITEAEVIETVLGRHSAAASEKFLQEVFWRTYWKGWLELRPSIWGTYRKNLDQAHAKVRSDPDLARRVAEAEEGRTGVDAFDAWMHELVTTGYLHNHARMWAASIWIFTLRLPWELGADMFLRHLLDGDPASNTLSWRWVAGLQTQGKHYVARSSNIAKYTQGRHNPEWRLNTQAEPLKGPAHPSPRPLPDLPEPDTSARTGILLTEEDLSPGFVLPLLAGEVVTHAALSSVAGRSPQAVGQRAQAFTKGALRDATSRMGPRYGVAGPVTETLADIVNWADEHALEQVVTPYAPVGPAATRLRDLRKTLTERGITLVPVIRAYDRAAWPHATHGFFRFKSQIPDLIDQLVDKSGDNVPDHNKLR